MSKEQLIRQWRLLELLSGKHFGVSAQRLIDESGASKATFYRDIDLLTQAGVPISSYNRNNEAWYRLEGEALPPLRPTPMQVAALSLARTFLGALEGTRIVEEYDALLARFHRVPPAPVPLSATAAAASVNPQIMRTIEDALSRQRQLWFSYTGREGTGERTVDPLALRISKDQHLFFDAFDRAKGEIRSYKPVRMLEARALDAKADAHPEYSDAMFAGAVKTWTGPTIEVEILLSAAKARFVWEWPLSAGQRLEPQPDGSVLVKASVAGLQEVSKWVLGWGQGATVRSPPELRQLIRDELTVMLSNHQE